MIFEDKRGPSASSPRARSLGTGYCLVIYHYSKPINPVKPLTEKFLFDIKKTAFSAAKILTSLLLKEARPQRLRRSEVGRGEGGGYLFRR